MTAPTPRPGIMDIKPYVGGESDIKGVSRVIKLSSNEGALGPSPKAMDAFKAMAHDMHRYPDGGATQLRKALAARWGVDADRIVCGAGSDELLGILCRAYAGPGDEVLYSAHGFLMYGIAAKSCGATPVTAPEVDLTASVDNLLKAVTPRTRIVFLANPNNPTGTYLPADEVKRLRAGLRPDILLVIDAAYAEFVSKNDYTPGIELVDAGDNTVMCRTFSKIFALGGLRLGWAYCP
ncbi:MAG TPA: histidinol-phosphate transaminase, partial [Candidatus Omnitrophota bacterium]|nr:histidinol-phosphate transaminase [Candidatus Omnitrophota bacterium]